MAVVGAVAGITGGDGSVTDHQPRSERREDLVAFFGNTAGTLLNGWTVHRSAVDDLQEDGSGRRFITTHTVVVKGYFGLKEADATEAAFDVLVDAVRAAIIASTTIWLNQPEAAPKTINTTITHSTLQNAVVHFAELTFDVDEITVTA